ncbi:Tim44/TimA family putative adaptor protein [Novosphingobium sp. FSY-8]|uniref:Tim44/TimA family putative adaptor protein n=1 Tax=Novosphingobium ovatum TaxID=1908523 RepID=A0ABW9XDI8_9SPHN|nr:Tim44/TimA family putative adaptor protein [Novosphingobium ovatum]NBC36603.1 Tim44/TimA family putative adaptor protein [Novosphingobium ovatum]
MTVQIVILAMIAAFLGMRLYSVLGRRAEHGEEPVQSRFDANAGPTGGAAPAGAPQAVPAPAARVRDMAPFQPAVENGLREIANADRRFDPAAFVEGARGAYRLILEAFWRGDKDELVHLCDPEVARSFAEAIDARVAAGEVPDNRLVRIEEAVITAASLTGPDARIAVRFVADIAAVTRNADGVVIAGSLNDAVEVRDVWTFRRAVHSGHPDWMLTETDVD